MFWLFFIFCKIKYYYWILYTVYILFGVIELSMNIQKIKLFYLYTNHFTT